MGMMTIAVKGGKQANPHDVETHRVTNLCVTDTGMIEAQKVASDGIILIEPDSFMGIVDTFDWGGE